MLALLVGLLSPLPLAADETCLSPYMAKIVGQEDFVYVWTLGIEGLGDGQDKLVTIDVRPDSSSYGQVIHSLSVGGRNEAHHTGLTDDRRFLWGGGLDTNKIFVFDIHTDPAKPRLREVIGDFVAKAGGVVGPHTFYALPGRMLITGLSNNKDHSGRSALVEYTNGGRYVTTHWMPHDGDLRGSVKTGQLADGYSYDARVQPRLNAMLSTSFTGWTNYMMDFGKMLGDAEAMKHFGNTVVLWDLHTRQPKQIFDVPGAPLEVRWAWGPNHNYAFTSTALTAQLYLIEMDEQGEWKASAVADIGDPKQVPLPVDISLSSDDRLLWASTFLDGMARLFDVSDPRHPRQIYSKKIGSQVNMVSQSWDGVRIYFSSSLLANWDKKGDENDQYVKLYHWNGKELEHIWTVDFIEQKLGRAHQMRFGAYSLYGSAE
jgi:selenium-binding protein 1